MGLGSGVAMSCGVGCRHGLDPDAVGCSYLTQPIKLYLSTCQEMEQKNPPELGSDFFFFFAFSRAALTAYEGSQARGLIGAVGAGLH